MVRKILEFLIANLGNPGDSVRILAFVYNCIYRARNFQILLIPYTVLGTLPPASIWTQQEIGYALGRGTKIISFKMGEDPTGFIGKHQAIPRRNRTAEEVAKDIDKLLEADPRTTERLKQARQAFWTSLED